MSLVRKQLSVGVLGSALACVSLAVCLAGMALPGSLGSAKAAEWRLEQPRPPARVAGEPPLTPIGLGPIGDIEFWAPNRGLLITRGNPPTIPPGIWAYDGEGWHELATVCGATDGRIAWAGPEEFWTVSDGRPGQAPNPVGGEPAPLADNTLCHFSGGQVVASYASLAFRADSYQEMHSAGCFGATDCWFGGESLLEPQVGAFHLHWNGSSLSAEAGPQGHTVQDMRLFDGRLFESVHLGAADRLSEPESAEHPSVLHEISPEGVQPTFVSLLPESPLTHSIVPEYKIGEFPEALDYLHLAADEEALWGAASPVKEPPENSTAAGITVERYTKDPETQQLIGTELLGENTAPSGKEEFPQDVVSSIAAEPGTDSAWMAINTQEDARKPSPLTHAQIANVSGSGAVATEELPTAVELQQGAGPKGGASKIACPAPEDCWLATTEGWLYHYTNGSEPPRDEDPAFAGLITFRPPDEGVPQVPPDAPPVDDSGLPGEVPLGLGTALEVTSKAPETKIKVPLLTNVHSRLVHGTTLELRFRLAVKARVKLIARRRRQVVASTPKRTLAGGNRKLQLRLDRRRWPTKLDLETHALAPLPTMTAKSGPLNTNTASTGLRVLPRAPSFTGMEPSL